MICPSLSLVLGLTLLVVCDWLAVFVGVASLFFTSYIGSIFFPFYRIH
jgi:hypothetical protein